MPAPLQVALDALFALARERRGRHRRRGRGRAGRRRGAARAARRGAAGADRGAASRSREDEPEEHAGRSRPGPSSDPVRLYLREIGRVPLLTAEQEVDLATRIEAGLFAAERLDGCDDPQLLRRDLATLVTDGVARQGPPRRGQPAAGRLDRQALRRPRHAVPRPRAGGQPRADPGGREVRPRQRGFKFSTYATWWIRQAVTRALADQGRTIRIPVHLVETINKLRAGAARDAADARPRPDARGDRPRARPAAREGARAAEGRAGAGVARDADRHRGRRPPRRHDRGHRRRRPRRRRRLPAAAGAARARCCTTSPSASRRCCGCASACTTGRPRTLEEVGREFGVTRERIRQIEAKTLAKLRQPARAGRLREFLSDT